MRDLLLVVPSRERPENIRRLAEAMNETCRGDTHLVVGLDADDPQRSEYEQIAVEFDVQDDLRFVVPWINHLAVPRAKDYRFIGHIGDDNVPRSEGWDVQIMQALERVPFAFGDDLYAGRETGTLCCHVFMRAQVIQTLGYMGPPCMKHMYVDPTWMAWGGAVGIEFLPDVILEHMHYSVGKSELDESYNASTSQIPLDLEAFNAYCHDGRLNADIEKLKGIPWSSEKIDRFREELNIPDHWPR